MQIVAERTDRQCLAGWPHKSSMIKPLRSAMLKPGPELLLEHDIMLPAVLQALIVLGYDYLGLNISTQLRAETHESYFDPSHLQRISAASRRAPRGPTLLAGTCSHLQVTLSSASTSSRIFPFKRSRTLYVRHSISRFPFGRK
jgi:hypothetical protein